MDDGGSHVYYRPKNGDIKKICVSGQGAVFKYGKNSLKPEDHVETESKPANLSGKVISLYDQCLALLARFTHCFDSLVDFPLEFGREIFDLAVPSLALDSLDTRRALATFGEAYPASFLPSCRLRSSLLLLNSYELSLPGLLAATARLDLSHCGLHDEHDLVGEVALLPRLATLSLAHNQLGEAGLRRLLGPRALASLAYLDWGGNRLGMKSINRIRKFATLTTVVLTEADLAKDPNTAKALSGDFRRMTCPRLEAVATTGFAVDLLDAWTAASQPKPPKPRNNFYSKPVLTPVGNTASLKDENKVMFERLQVKSGALPPGKRRAEIMEQGNHKKSRMEHSENKEYENSLLDLYKS